MRRWLTGIKETLTRKIAEYKKAADVLNAIHQILNARNLRRRMHIVIVAPQRITVDVDLISEKVQMLRHDDGNSLSIGLAKIDERCARGLRKILDDYVQCLFARLSSHCHLVAVLSHNQKEELNLVANAVEGMVIDP